jgi:CDP-3, 6-dideoxy-D-glycero-L-glycero-4-hexulose-4-reductase
MTARKTVLITGGNGFLGRSLKDAFIASGLEVVCVSFRGDEVDHLITQTRQLLTAGTLHAVINVGASQTTKDDMLALRDLTQSNVFVPALIALELREVLPKMRVPLVTFGSSWQINAVGAEEPFNAYAASKTAADAFLRHYALDGQPIATLRLYDTYGPGDTRNKVVNLIVDAFIRMQELPMSPGGQLIDLVHIHDVCRAVFRVIEILADRDIEGHQTFSVRSGRPITITELVHAVADVMGRLDLVDSIIKSGVYPYRKRERFELDRDLDPIPEWSPLISLKEGVEGLIRDRRRLTGG